jgi:hypothetical protein
MYPTAEIAALFVGGIKLNTSMEHYWSGDIETGNPKYSEKPLPVPHCLN